MAEVVETSPSSPSRVQPSQNVSLAQNNKTPKSHKKRATGKTRSGSPNYTKEELNVMFAIVEDVLPMGRNQWGIVADKFNKWAAENDSVEREADSLRTKFDKLAGAKKPTGEANPPPEISKAKEIARAINQKAVAVSLGDSSSDEDDEDEVSSKSKEAESEKVGSRRSARKQGATGVYRKKQKKEERLESVFESMAENIGRMTEVLTSYGSSTNAETQSQGMTREEVESIFQENMKPTNDMLASIQALLQGKLTTNAAQVEVSGLSGEERGSGGRAPSEN